MKFGFEKENSWGRMDACVPSVVRTFSYDVHICLQRVNKSVLLFLSSLIFTNYAEIRNLTFIVSVKNWLDSSVVISEKYLKDGNSFSLVQICQSYPQRPNFLYLTGGYSRQPYAIVDYIP